ncbi:MAG: branched-chain amino acid ABC transporter permease [Chloroflexi bacterium]|mgnify:CR=1 FL=1|nr:branched-chain amino acid ABC transporter permease [Chloroflexota bacterium]
MKRLQVPSWITTLAVALLAFFGVWYAKQGGHISVYWYQVVQLAAITAISALGLNLIYGFNGQFSLGHIGFYAIGAYGSALITKDYVTKWSGSQTGALAWMLAGQIGLVFALVLINKLGLPVVKKRISSSLSEHLAPHEANTLGTLAVLLISAASLAASVAVALGLHALLAPALETIISSLPEGASRPLIFALALINGGSIAALVSYLVGLALLRLGSDYFGIATLGFAVMVYTALQNSDLVIETMKGARGMVGIPPWSTWPWVAGGLVLLAIVMRNMLRSSHGRAMISVREDEIASQSMGVDVTQLKNLAFTMGGFYAGVAGALYAHLYGFLHPSSFSMIKGFDPLIIIVFGGLGSMTGTILASVMFALVIEGLRVILPQGFEDWRFVIYPIILLLIMLLRPSGLLGTSEWGWLRAPLPPERDIPVPNRSLRGSAVSASSEEE